MRNFLKRLLSLLSPLALRLVSSVATSPEKVLIIRGVPIGEVIEWTVADGHATGQFLDISVTGQKLKIMMEDRIIASALSTEDDKKSYRDGLIDMYRYILTKRASQPIAGMDQRMRKEFLANTMPRGG